MRAGATRFTIVVEMGAGPIDATPSAQPHGVGDGRAATTRFIGREAELAAVQAMLRRIRLLTVMGLGGSGKTRLAIELAARVGSEFRDGCCFVDLAPLTEARLTADVVAAALGVPERPGRTPLEVMAEALKRQQMLLILDNCEHVAADAALLADRLLAACPSLRILAVSRVALGAQGEQRWRLPALGLAASVELFCDRAGLVGPFQLTDANRPAIESICRQLDGLPLAIELAAARTRVLGPGQILDRMSNALEALAPGPRGGPARHQTLRAAMEWSCRLLSPAELRLLERLAVFPGDFDLAAAEAVGGGSILGSLTALVDQSLVVGELDAADGMRYRLPEPLRQYLGETSRAQTDVTHAEERHAEHFLGLARLGDAPLPLGELAKWFERFRRDEHNFRKALEWGLGSHSSIALQLAIALARTWLLGARVAEGRDWMERALALPAGDEHLRALGLFWSARMAWMCHDYERAWTDNQRSLALMRQLDDGVGVGECLFGLAVTALAQDDIGRARSLARDAMEAHRATGYRWGLGRACMLSGWTAFLDEDREGGISLFEEALDINRAERDSHGTALALSGLVLLDIDRGQLRAARRKAIEMMDLVRTGLTVLATDSMWIWSYLLLASAEGRDETVLRFEGALDGQRIQAGAYQADGLRIPLRTAIEQARHRVGSRAARRLLAEGSSLTMDRLAALAWDELAAPASTSLTPREREVAHLVKEGLTNAEIARRLGISRRTAETHVDHIREKLGLRSRTQIAAYVTQTDGP